ncbi:uncharacterized protein LOC131943699 [Physella acuta]|uniref:uncharacterized protein LOC131943699 n=1 Tax=Physella acuta TaxID=109671 RepID=UPI0027DCACE5|nr:uncharacterized protein LOC131943699 [Physella acuta]
MQQEPARNWRLLLGLSGMVVGLVLHTVGQGQPYWASFTPENSSKSVYTGLWEVCGELGCYRTAIDSITLTPSYHASRAFAIMGVLSGAAAVLTIFLYVFQVKLIYVTLSAALGALSSVSIGVCAVSWVTYLDESSGDTTVKCGFAFYLSLIGCIVILTSSAVSLLMIIKFSR